MKRIQLATILFCTQYACITWAMQPLNETDMAEATGQDGITIGLSFPEATISYDQIMMTDDDGFTGQANAASLVVASTTYSATQGVRLFSAATGGATVTQPIAIKIDADAGVGGNKPVMNIHASMPTDLKRIRINPFSIFLASGSDRIHNTTRVYGNVTNYAASGAGSLKNNVREIVRLGTGGIDIIFTDHNATYNPNNVLATNIQLGNTPQGAFLKFTGGSISEINTVSPLQILSYNGANPSNPALNNCTSPGFDGCTTNSIKIGLNLKATNTDTGFRLYDHDGAGSFSGFYMNLTNDGLIVAADGTTDGLDITLSNITIGNAEATNTNTFNGLKNGSIGNIGLTGIKVTDFKTTVKGL